MTSATRQSVKSSGEIGRLCTEIKMPADRDNNVVIAAVYTALRANINIYDNRIIGKIYY